MNARRRLTPIGIAALLALLMSAAALAAQATAAPAQAPETKQGTAKKKAEATPPPTQQEIADAKAKGLVWVNLSTRVYHKEGRYFGATKRGKFMTEADAKAAGYHEAKEPAAGKKSAKDTTKK